MKQLVLKLKKLFIKDKKFFLAIVYTRLFSFLPDTIYLKIIFRFLVGYKLDLNSPKTFNAKLQWLKLYYHNPIYTKLVDKYAVKKWVSERIGEEYVIPTLGVWNNAFEINFENLPNQFVLKTTNGGGGDVIICKDKTQFNRKFANKHLNKALKKNIYKYFREWPYKDVPPRIIAEKYMMDDFGDVLTDYKFHVFRGVPKILLVVSGRFGNQKACYDYLNPATFERMNFHTKAGNMSVNKINMPPNYQKMIDIVKKLSEGLDYVRVDLYNINGKIYFGELTFFDGSGFDRFYPPKWDYIIGEWLKLPSEKIL